MARKNSIIATSVEGTLVTITVEGVDGAIVQDVSELNDEIRTELLIHGYRQKISDRAAISAALSPTAQMKFDAMRECSERLRSGEWSARRGDGSSGVPSLWRRAFGLWIERAAAKKKVAAPSSETIDAQFEAVGGWSKIKTIPAVAAIADELRAATPSAIDGDDLLAGLLG